MSFEFLLYQPAFERIVLPYARNLKTLGIEADVVRVDQSQYVQRVRNFNFDMMVGGWGQSPSPATSSAATGVPPPPIAKAARTTPASAIRPSMNWSAR